MTIHATAVISDGARIDPQAQIGPYVVVGPHVEIGAGTTVGAHCVIDGHTTIGRDCKIYAHVSIGLEPQDLSYAGEPTGVRVGDRTTLREFVTIHRATKEGFTEVGQDCFLMNYVHISHDSKLGRGVILANAVMMAGHVSIGDNTVMSGMCIFHQHVRVGRGCMVSGLTGSRSDLPPFTTCDGRPAKVRGINMIGLKRNKIGPEPRQAIKQAYKLIYNSGLNVSQALERVEAELGQFPEVAEIVEFIRSSRRGIIPATFSGEGAIDEVPAGAAI